MSTRRHTSHTEPAAQPAMGLTGSTGLMEPPTLSQAVDAGTLVAALLRGEDVNKLDGAWAICIVVGYGISRFRPNQGGLMAQNVEALPPEANAARNAAADHLDALKAEGIMAAGRIPWEQLISLLLQLIPLFIQKREV